MIGKNIRYYRQMKKMSQAELARRLNVARMTVSHYENGERTPDYDTMQRLAVVLEVPLAALSVTYGAIPQIEHGAFRAQKSMTRDEQEYILTCADRYLSRLFQVVSFLGDAALTAAPILQRVAVQTPEQAAAHLRTLLGLPMTGPVGNITDMLENKGFIVCPVDVPESKFSGNSGYANGRPYITVNTTMPAERQRFTLIHELAHLVFVFEEGQDEEKLVDQIAGAFLLPAEDILRELGPRRTSIISDLRLVQREYGIAMQTVAIRARQTGIISQDVYTQTQKWFSAKGYRKNEQSGLIPEDNHLLEQLTIRAVAEDEISVAKAAELLQVPLVQARKLCFGGV